MSKKRKPPPQSTTLFSFFRENDGVNEPSFTRKITIRPLLRTPLVKKESHSQTLWTPQEVIVIDSDDEAEAQVQHTVEKAVKVRNRHKHESDGADIEDRNRSTSKRSHSHSTRRASVSRDENVFIEGGTWMDHQNQANLQPSSVTYVESSGLKELRQKFYASSSSPELVSVPRPADLEECPSFHLGEEVATCNYNESLDDWNMNLDNDYQEAQGFSDNCDDTEADGPLMAERENSYGLSESLDACPMCNMTFIDFDVQSIQGHVNACLDSKPPVTESIQSSATRKILRPLSSFLFPQPPKTKPTGSAQKLGNSNAFSVLMSSHDENAAWEEAQAHEDRSFKPTKNNRRKAPFYKVLTGMPITVDAFRYGCIPGITAYFLTHAHSDHYTNLSSNWDHGPIYCSETTANLIARMLSVDRKWLKPLPMDTPIEIPNTSGVKVTLIDANHCPGSCLFLFEGRQTVNAGDSTYRSNFVGSDRVFRYLHCGDFRACPRQAMHPSIRSCKFDAVYLDTTYLNPRYCFPPQPLVSVACSELARRIVKGESLERSGGEKKGAFAGWLKVGEAESSAKATQEKGDVLIVVGTYSIGKERIVKAIARELDTKVYCDSRKAALLRCQDDPELHSLLTTDPLSAGVHIVPLGQVASDRFKEYISRWPGRWARAVAFRPTGWTYSPPAGSDPTPPVASVIARAQARTFTHEDLKPGRNSTRELVTYGVPYSEHSSFAELACFALSIDCGRVIATVNVGSAPARARMQKWVERWEIERKKRREQGEAGVVKYRSLDYW